jgi:uncharacterized protein (TIGR02118 family)
MVRVTTVALIERKPGVSRSLFSRYWRDVHGVMAARIPGFETYTQYHVSSVTDYGSLNPEPFEGVAVVTFADERARQGLVSSEVTRHIHRDEQNVFRRALLYSLAAGASVTRCGAPAGGPSAVGCFLLVPAGCASSLESSVTALGTDGLIALSTHDLTSGDPGAWNATDVDDGGTGRRFVAVVHGEWRDETAALTAIRRCVAVSAGDVAAYRIDAAYVMVEAGRPTQIGLRGLDAVRTIEEAGATNQLEEDVVRAVYGALGRA